MPIVIQHTPAGAIVDAAAGAGQFRANQVGFEQGIQSQHLALQAQGQQLAARQHADQLAAQEQYRQDQLRQQWEINQANRADYMARLQAQIDGRSELQGQRDEAAAGREQMKYNAQTGRWEADRAQRDRFHQDTVDQRDRQADQRDTQLAQQNEYRQGQLDVAQQRVDKYVAPDYAANTAQRNARQQYEEAHNAWRDEDRVIEGEIKSAESQQKQLLLRASRSVATEKASLIRQARELDPRIAELHERRRQHSRKIPASPAAAPPPNAGGDEPDDTMGGPGASLAPQDAAVAEAQARAAEMFKAGHPEESVRQMLRDQYGIT